MTRLKQRLEGAWLVRFAVRLRVLWSDRALALKRPGDSLRWLVRSREISNFTYELSNMGELSQTVASALDVPVASALDCIDELEHDAELRTELSELLTANPKRDNDPRYGYRYMYYCVARLARPKVIVEVGTHDGLGAALLLRALERNAAEGFPGELHTFDSTEQSGWLIPERLRARCTRHIGDAEQTLEPVLHEHGCDFLIDDIGFAFEGKAWLFDSALGLGKRPLVIASEFPARADGAAATGLSLAAEAQGGSYAEFVEDPRDHFWPGHTQGLARFGAPVSAKAAATPVSGAAPAA